MPRPVAPEVRFWSRVDGEDYRDCWIWRAGRTKQGYGGFHPAKGQMVLAHRWAYEFLIAPIPPGLCLDHLCRTRRCVNPWHLEPVTLAENTRRGGNAIKTHCPAGHPYGPNPYRCPRGTRRCRECVREAYHRKKAA